ncbi:MAG TPA: 4-hydroxyphenylacetate 3-hydroxylase N-terminal domain-containing protein [Methylomirabilota bacterium]|jgi:4-hydroxyphenylacetate 3-monooxygenase|nr:4-hydroxyphenylacetate 3-hydroxylase N-terminal domain-containing protein [Methylomirabilota bacterium]
MRPFTGKEFLESLRDGREIWIYGQRVDDVTTHPAFRNPARMVARLYDALHDAATRETLTCPTDTGSGGVTHRFFRAPTSAADLVGARDAIAGWARLSYGWMGRSPDYKAAFLATLGGNAEFYAPYQANALRFYRESQERVLFMNHALVQPPVDRHRPPDEVADVYVHVEKETDAGLVVSGAKVVATGSALTHYNFIAHPSTSVPIKTKEFALTFMAPMSAPGVKLICRPSYAMAADVMGSPFDYPLSSRFDENDAILVLDKVLVPWENVLCYEDVEKAITFFKASGFFPRAMLHGCTRLAVKLDFVCGLLLKAADAVGSGANRNIQSSIGEVIAWRNLFWGLSDAMARTPAPWAGGTVLPNPEYAQAYRVFATVAYPRVKEITESILGSALIYQNSHAADFLTPELRPYLDKYFRGSDGTDAVERIKLMKLLWDAMGTEFGGRHELYERNYAGAPETIRFITWEMAQASGDAARFRAFAEACMAEYDLAGWKAPDLISPADVSLFLKKPR